MYHLASYTEILSIMDASAGLQPSKLGETCIRFCFKWWFDYGIKRGAVGMSLQWYLKLNDTHIPTRWSGCLLSC
jgi:hypothetical protein